MALENMVLPFLTSAGVAGIIIGLAAQKNDREFVGRITNCFYSTY